EINSDEKFDKLFNALEDNTLKPKQGIFYNGQVFDAHNFMSDIVRDAKKSIVLIDNYVDDSVLIFFSKNQNIDITIYTKTISKQLKQDVDKYNTQYKNLTLKTFKDSHDRFMIVDDKDVYHIGASLKDLGKKWFAFSKFESDSFGLLERLK
ncbi:MAG: ORF6N domain-containing protein, partial [Campylobacterota bacterium]|nr:ORF6N domain-containing protein [Campylobacterota bacterium]